MVRFKKSINNKEVLLIYGGYQGVDWIFEKIEDSIITIHGVFNFSRNELLTKKESLENQFDEVEFRVATRKDDYYCFSKSVLGINHDLYIHDSITLPQSKNRN